MLGNNQSLICVDVRGFGSCFEWKAMTEVQHQQYVLQLDHDSFTRSQVGDKFVFGFVAIFVFLFGFYFIWKELFRWFIK